MLRLSTLVLAGFVITFVSFSLDCKLLAVPGLYVSPVCLVCIVLLLLFERNLVGDGAKHGRAGGEQNEEEHERAATAGELQSMKSRLHALLPLATTLLLMLAPSVKNLATDLSDFWTIALYAAVGVIAATFLYFLFMCVNMQSQQAAEAEADYQEAPIGNHDMIVIIKGIDFSHINS